MLQSHRLHRLPRASLLLGSPGSRLGESVGLELLLRGLLGQECGLRRLLRLPRQALRGADSCHGLRGLPYHALLFQAVCCLCTYLSGCMLLLHDGDRAGENGRCVPFMMHCLAGESCDFCMCCFPGHALLLNVLLLGLHGCNCRFGCLVGPALLLRAEGSCLRLFCFLLLLLFLNVSCCLHGLRRLYDFGLLFKHSTLYCFICLA
mmetsp:Transcript_71368/g.123943  ORF Transcript_71368/g.123943 Transcript_71368/m.123943 type:complete len:205 (+) Transcript_71368:880-1494(+)